MALLLRVLGGLRANGGRRVIRPCGALLNSLFCIEGGLPRSIATINRELAAVKRLFSLAPRQSNKSHGNTRPSEEIRIDSLVFANQYDKKEQ